MKYKSRVPTDAELYIGGIGNEYTPGLTFFDVNMRILANQKVRVLSITIELEGNPGKHVLIATCPAKSNDPERFARFAVPLMAEDNEGKKES